MFFSFMDNTITPASYSVDLSSSQVAEKVASLTGDKNCISRIKTICENMAVGECYQGMPEYQSINGNYGYKFGRQNGNLVNLFETLMK